MINLCFHGVGACVREREPGESGYWVSRDVFLPMLDLIRDRADVRLSFDDGNRSDVEEVLPALTERGLTADFFALAGRLDDPSSLSATDLQHLRGAGMAIGNHGWGHVPWRKLSAAERQREFIDARAVLIEASQGAIADAALPLGRYDRGTLTALKSAGYRTVFTSDRFRARPRAWLQARYSLGASDTVESLRHILEAPSTSELRPRAKSLVKRLR